MDATVGRLVEVVAGAARTEALFRTLDVHPGLLTPGVRVPRAVLAQAMNMLLFEDLVRRVPEAQAYLQDDSGRKAVFDHGALRTVRVRGGELPEGELAFTRILEPLGFGLAALYPLERLRMTGRAYCHQDFPDAIAQYFLSEFHPETFSDGFRGAVARVVSSSRDPLPAWAKRSLDTLTRDRELVFDEAARLLPNLVACFDRQHQLPTLADYEVLLAESKEMAWIATEGNAFNHATDRVADVGAVADRQKALGRPMKERIEVSVSGLVMQTAFRATRVWRGFLGGKVGGKDGPVVLKEVPGSFFEFITRKQRPEGGIDLRFDVNNATGIFKMTAGR